MCLDLDLERYQSFLFQIVGFLLFWFQQSRIDAGWPDACYDTVNSRCRPAEQVIGALHAVCTAAFFRGIIEVLASVQQTR